MNLLNPDRTLGLSPLALQNVSSRLDEHQESQKEPKSSICLTWLPHSARYLSMNFKLNPGGCLCVVRSSLGDQHSAHTRILHSKQIKSIRLQRGGWFGGFVGSAGVEKVKLEPKTGLVWC